MYHEFTDPETGETHGSFEVFSVFQDVDFEGLEDGFYWHACFPGCLPDGEPCGPFETEEEAIQDANDF